MTVDSAHDGPPEEGGLDRPAEVSTRPDVIADARLDARADAEDALPPDVPSAPLAPGWARSLGGSSRTSASAVAVDPMGNVYVAGHFQESMTLGSTRLTTTGYGNFLASFTSAGALRWLRSLGSSDQQRGTGIAALPGGGVLFTGGAVGVVDFGCGPTGSNSTQVSVALVSLNADGTCRWSRRYEGFGPGIGYDVAVDRTGNSYVVGHQSGSTSFGGPRVQGVGTFGFVASFTPAGEHRWSQAYSGAGTSACAAVAVQPSGDVLVLVESIDALDLGAARLTMRSSFFAAVALDRDGAYRWHSVGSEDAGGTLRGWSVAAASENTWLLGGIHQGTLRLGARRLASLTAEQGFHVQLGGDGTVAQVVALAPMASREYTTVNAVAADASGRRFVGGASLAPSGMRLGALELSSRGGMDAWWASLDVAGVPRRARVMGTGPVSAESIEALAVGPDGALYAAGTMRGNIAPYMVACAVERGEFGRAQRARGAWSG
ncbi:MAG: SBBP repeat-containing protein [Polyangiales bacterium]